MTEADVHIGPALEALVAEQGVYTPIELLLRLEWVSYAHYRAWRTGERASLVPGEPGDAQALRQLLDHAAHRAERRGLAPQLDRFFGWETLAGVELRAATASELDARLRTRYAPVVHATQLDLFQDNAATMALNRLREALMARGVDAARAALARLETAVPGHVKIAPAHVLVEAITPGRASVTAGEALALLDRLERQWLPAAEAVLGGDTRDFLAPWWAALAQSLRGHPFDPDRPNAHASWACAQCLDWRGVCETVREVENFAAHPILLARLADAEWRTARRDTALVLWWALCWSHPEAAAEMFESPSFPDLRVARYWQAFNDADVRSVGASWLPAFALLEEPGLARMTGGSGRSDAPARVYDTLALLLRRDADASLPDEHSVALRHTLQTLQPEFLERYLAQRR